MTITTKHIDTLWSKMARIYGHKWLSNFGERDDGTWLQGLADLLPEELAQGLRACLTRADEWPPTLPEFRRLCAGLASRAAAIDEACSSEFNVSPLAWVMRGGLSSWDRTHLPSAELRKRYSAAYDHAFEKSYLHHMNLALDERKMLSKP